LRIFNGIESKLEKLCITFYDKSILYGAGIFCWYSIFNQTSSEICYLPENPSKLWESEDMAIELEEDIALTCSVAF
jgi:hypothetical protein